MMIDWVPGFLYGLLNVKVIVDVALFPGIVTVVEGVIVEPAPVPAVLVPDQNWS